MKPTSTVLNSTFILVTVSPTWLCTREVSRDSLFRPFSSCCVLANISVTRGLLVCVGTRSTCCLYGSTAACRRVARHRAIYACATTSRGITCACFRASTSFTRRALTSGYRWVSFYFFCILSYLYVWSMVRISPVLRFLPWQSSLRQVVPDVIQPSPLPSSSPSFPRHLHHHHSLAYVFHFSSQYMPTSTYFPALSQGITFEKVRRVA